MIELLAAPARIFGVIYMIVSIFFVSWFLLFFSIPETRYRSNYLALLMIDAGVAWLGIILMAPIGLFVEKVAGFETSLAFPIAIFAGPLFVGIMARNRFKAEKFQLRHYVCRILAHIPYLGPLTIRKPILLYDIWTIGLSLPLPILMLITMGGSRPS